MRRSASNHGRKLALGAAVAGSALLAASAAGAIQASFDCSPSCAVPPGTSITFASNSTSTSAISDYAWDLDGDGLYGSADRPAEPEGTDVRRAQRTFPRAGSFTVGLRVRNIAREASFATRTVTVSAPMPPTGEQPLGPSPFQPLQLLQPAASADDLCPGTQPRARVLLRGCSLLDAIVSPAALIESVGDSIGTARGSLGATRGLRRLTNRSRNLLGTGMKRLQLAGRRVSLAPCAGSQTAGLALRSATSGAEGIANAVEKTQRDIVLQASRAWRRRFPEKGDSDAFHARFHLLSLKRQLTQDAVADLRAVRRLMGAACEASNGSQRLRARVVSLDNATGLAELSDGRQLAFGAARDVDGLAPGAMVSARGVALQGGLFVAETLNVVGDLEATLSACTFTPQIAPVQDFSQGYAEILYQDQRGYRGDLDIYQLERGMGLGAVRGPNCPKDDYALNVFLTYRNTAETKVKKLIGVLRGFPSGEAPARIPMDIKSKTGVLSFELYGLDCELEGDIPLCGGEQLEFKRSSSAVIRKQGGWGKAVFDVDLFSVEDGSQTDFDVATLDGVEAPLLPGAGVFGVGYGLSDGESLRPQRKFISMGEQFAVHDDIPSATDPGGLLSAYVYGTRNGFPYQYVAKLPDIVTDVVRFCPNISPAFYRLPWKAGTYEKVTQGNNNQPTHSGGQAFAFDFKMPKFTIGYATRGGVVTLVEEDRTKQSNPNTVKYVKQISGGTVDLWQPGNTLIIKHQDSTYSLYTHMQPKGVYPEEGDVVERGDKIIVIGNTGNITGPHLHYHVTTTGETEGAALGNTILIRFEVTPIYAPGQVVPVCRVPKRNEVWASTNSKPSS
jgi:murein DD-endopeptidase MepM/ murein hydrolase activator NlpD